VTISRSGKIGSGTAMKKAALLSLAALTLIAAAPDPATPWLLRGDGLSGALSGETVTLRFGVPRSAAIARLTRLLRKPRSVRTVADCGQGDSMVLAVFQGGLTVHFLKGKFSGWSLDAPADPRFRTPEGIRIGSDRAAVLKAYPDADIDDGSLGVMFTREAGPSGFLDSMKPGARVIGLYAGETCMIS